MKREAGHDETSDSERRESRLQFLVVAMIFAIATHGVIFTARASQLDGGFAPALATLDVCSAWHR